MFKSMYKTTLRYLQELFKKHLQNVSQRTLKDILKLSYIDFISLFGNV